MSENNSQVTKQLGNKNPKIVPLYCLAINLILNKGLRLVNPKIIQRHFNIDYSHATRIYKKIKNNNPPIK
ncbi:hypothetical protein N0H69_15450 [Yersinia alsatica]|uniref:Uncharacterized protein n=1 Tax=Yersinia alsatica TaxID=2890317 RepID=A0ABY5UKS7_9GAMM|nr:hypothetical protein [Yersinia alsatica]OWF68624.1 hypothetical protein B4901_12155 [Yersinia frederiksenii]UWM44086.1 hypothetical protein N0H69_15450 [Yersinia alsatica]CNK95567.1 Uncharacterised protein [Yersinia frederiksenii]CNL12388.1 Uncharacterised protein [Yersinia frederiksenii]